MLFPALDPDARDADRDESLEDDDVLEDGCADDLREAA